MAATDSTQNDIISAWQNLIEKSVKANTTFLQESSKIFTDILSKKIETKDLLKINTEVLSAAANNLIKLNIANTENLVNFGIEISKSFFSFTNKNNTNTDSGTPAGTVAATASERSQINLSASQGQSLSTSFYLNSHNAFSQAGKFYHEGFIDEASGKSAAITMTISPLTFTLEAGKSIKVDITLTVMKDVIPGTYKSTVRLHGMNNQEFDIVLNVENKKELTVDSKTLPAVKKAAAKKTIDKKTSSQKSTPKRSKKE